MSKRTDEKFLNRTFLLSTKVETNRINIPEQKRTKSGLVTVFCRIVGHNKRAGGPVYETANGIKFVYLHFRSFEGHIVGDLESPLDDVKRLDVRLSPSTYIFNLN
jgi:hypothetical protein